MAGRNLTREEWATYIGDPDDSSLAYHAACSEALFPAPDSLSAPPADRSRGMPLATAETAAYQTVADAAVPREH